MSSSLADSHPSTGTQELPPQQDGDDRFAVKAAVSITHAKFVDRDVEKSDEIAVVALSTPTNCSITNAACRRLGVAILKGEFEVFGLSAEGKGAPFRATRFRLYDYRDVCRYDTVSESQPN